MTFQNTDRKPTKDHAFEKKREEHLANVTAIEAKMGKLRQRISMISDEIRTLTAGDTNLAAREELRNQIEVLRAQKDQLIAQKNPLFQKLQDSLGLFRRKVDNLQVAKEKLPFKRVEDVDKLLTDYDQQVTSGQLKLIEEKRIVAEMSKLRKARKQIETFNGDSTMVDLKKSIDVLRAGISEKDSEIKIVQEKLNNLHEQLGQLSSSRSVSQTKIKALLNEKGSLSKSMNQLYEEKNALAELFTAAKKAHAQWMQNHFLSLEEQYIQRDIDYNVRKLEQEINDLAIPANSSKIQEATTLQNYLRHNVLKETPSSQSQQAAPAGRKVEALDKSLVMKTKFNKDDETYMNIGKPKVVAPKKVAEPVATDGLYKLPIWILADFEALQIRDIPLSCKKDDILRLIDNLDAAKADLTKGQEEKASTIDTEKQAIESKISALKSRNVHEEAVKSMKVKEEQRKTNAPIKGAPGLTVQG